VGSIDFAPGSLFAVEVSEVGGGSWDQLAVAGNADLSGAALQVDPGAGDYLVQVDAIILTAASIAGDFASVGPQFAFLDISHAIVGNQILTSRATLTLGFRDAESRAIAAALEVAEAAGSTGIDAVFDSPRHGRAASAALDSIMAVAQPVRDHASCNRGALPARRGAHP
jgi:hypothetical protein